MIKSPYESTSWLWRVWANICDDGRLNRATEREKGWVNVDVKNGRKKRDSVSFSWFFDYSWLERVARSFGCLFLSYTSRVCWRWGGLMLWTKQLIIHPTIGAFLFLFFHWRRREEKRRKTRHNWKARDILRLVLLRHGLFSSSPCFVLFLFLGVLLLRCHGISNEFLGAAFIWLGWILISYTPADTRNNNNNNSQPATSAGSVYMDEKQFFCFFPIDSIGEITFAIRFDRWNIKRAVCRPPVGIWSASSCRASWAVASHLLRLLTSRSAPSSPAARL